MQQALSHTLSFCTIPPPQPTLMTLPQTSIKTILAYLDPHLETLQTGFPTSTRPNELVLTKEQKQQKIEASLTNDPGIFLTKWGSVILYPRPVPSTSAVGGHTDGDRHSLGAEHGLTAKDILDLFAALAGKDPFCPRWINPCCLLVSGCCMTNKTLWLYSTGCSGL
jgi:hypothetical protein